MKYLLASLALVACAATGPTTAIDATYTAAASIDAAIKAADVAINSGTLKGSAATTAIRSLGLAKASVQAAIAAQVPASGASK